MISNRELFQRNLAHTTNLPLGLEIERAKGNYLYGPDGKKYLDLISGISVSNIGHLHPNVVAAIHAQLEKHMHLQVYGEYVVAPQVQLATKLLELLPKKFESVYLTNSGAEAIEGAMKLAKRATGRHEIISFKNAYHGSTHGALSIMGGEAFKQAFRPLLPAVRQLDFNEIEQLQHITKKTAAVFVEPVQGEAGYNPATPEFLTALRKRCTAVGALLVFDEIQTGIGRTGHWFAMQKYGVTPDVVALAKGLGGGMPIGAFCSPKSLMDTLKENPMLGHITTFGGHPVSCAAALATLQTIAAENLMHDIPEKEILFRKLLKHPKIKAVTGTGLMLAAHVDSFETVERTMHRCLQQGVITDWFLFNQTALRISPPLPISEEEIEMACGVICDSLS
jgi:acetylornithine/succinyldiaminopimelate/putrescine aminotransferase